MVGTTTPTLLTPTSSSTLHASSPFGPPGSAGAGGGGPSNSTPMANEDAVAIATDFFHSMDNVGNEVEHILKEILYKDERMAEIQARLNSRTTSILRNAKSSNPPPNPSSSSPALALNPLTPKDQQAYTKIQAEWTKLDLMQAEKETLAQRLVSIITRHKERAREEYKKIGGDVTGLVEMEQTVDLRNPVGLAALVSKYTGMDLGGVAQGGRGSLGPGSGGAVGSSGVDERASKKRKSTHMSGTSTPSYHDMPPPSLPSLNLPASHSHASITITPPTHTSSSSSSSHPTSHLPMYHQQISLTARPSSAAGGSTSSGTGGGRKAREAMAAAAQPVEIDMDTGEGEVDEAGEDNALYCFCQEKSYGEMIGCDNEDCRFEWFHLKCVKVEPPLPANWYCPECVATFGFADSSGPQKPKQKGRKK